MTSIEELLGKLRNTGADYVVRITDAPTERDKEILRGRLENLTRTYEAIHQYLPKRKH